MLGHPLYPCICTFICPLEVIIGFSEELYAVGEEDVFVMVCAALTGQTERTLLFTLSTSSLSATGCLVD